MPNAGAHRRFRPDMDAGWDGERLKLPASVPIVLLAGRIVPHKGIEHFSEAARDVPDAQFLIAGEGPLLGPMKRLAATLGVEARVRFLGRVSEENLPKY